MSSGLTMIPASQVATHGRRCAAGEQPGRDLDDAEHGLVRGAEDQRVELRGQVLLPVGEQPDEHVQPEQHRRHREHRAQQKKRRVRAELGAGGPSRWVVRFLWFYRTVLWTLEYRLFRQGVSLSRRWWTDG